MPECLNILIFGLAGAGKSAFINTAFTAMSDKDELITQAAKVGGQSEHVTQSIRRHLIPGTQICLWDTWGLTPETYQGHELDMLTAGMLPGNWTMKSVVQNHEAELQQMYHSKHQRMPHAVFCCVPWSALEDEVSMSNLNSQFRRIGGKNYNPIVILTRVDEMNLRVRTNALSPSSELGALRRRAADLFGIPSNSVTYAVPYFDEEERNFDIDRLMFKTLDRGAQTAQEFLLFTQGGRGDGDTGTCGLGAQQNGMLAAGVVVATSPPAPRLLSPPRDPDADPASPSELAAMFGFFPGAAKGFC